MKAAAKSRPPSAFSPSRGVETAKRVYRREAIPVASHCRETYMRAMLALACSLGFRKGELLSLKVGDVDLMEGILRLRDSKNGEPRQVSLTAETRGLLAACIDGKSADAAVFTRGSGNAVQDFRGTWAAVTKAASCAGLLFHSLRRSSVRNLIRAGVTEHVAMKISPHKTASVFRRYDIVDARDLADAAKKIESVALSYGLVKNGESEQVDENSKAEQHDTIQ